MDYAFTCGGRLAHKQAENYVYGQDIMLFIKSIITGKEGRNYENHQGYSQNKEKT